MYLENEKIIKSKQRVQQHGEVFTPKKVVNLMLGQKEIQENIRNLGSTFLEPAAGEGAFLTELLRRKMNVAKRISKTRDEYDENALLSLSSLYGIELLEDNLELLVMNMIMMFSDMYTGVVLVDFNTKSNDIRTRHVIDSAKTIIRANMVQGNALTREDVYGDSLIFSEWELLPGKPGMRKIKRTLHTLDSIMRDEQTESEVNCVRGRSHDVEEIDLFEGFFEDSDSEKDSSEQRARLKYTPVRFTDVYKELIEGVEERNED